LFGNNEWKDADNVRRQISQIPSMVSKFATEICVMGILTEYHRQGIGKKLLNACEQLCRQSKTEFLTVKTLAESRESKSYEKTRMFYLAQGFRPIEVFPTIWDEANPCLFMIKKL